MPSAFEYSVRWSNPHTQPPEGMDRVQLRVRIEVRKGQGAPGCPPEVESLKWQLGMGWAIFVGDIDDTPRRELSAEQKGKIRRRRLEQRMRTRHPLFADEFIEEALARKPDYYAGAVI